MESGSSAQGEKQKGVSHRIGVEESVGDGVKEEDELDDLRHEFNIGAVGNEFNRGVVGRGQVKMQGNPRVVRNRRQDEGMSRNLGSVKLKLS